MLSTAKWPEITTANPWAHPPSLNLSFSLCLSSPPCSLSSSSIPSRSPSLSPLPVASSFGNGRWYSDHGWPASERRVSWRREQHLLRELWPQQTPANVRGAGDPVRTEERGRRWSQFSGIQCELFLPKMFEKKILIYFLIFIFLFLFLLVFKFITSAKVIGSVGWLVGMLVGRLAW